MRKLLMMTIAVFTLTFASAFVFRGAFSPMVTLSARELYMSAEVSQYDFTYLKDVDLSEVWENAKDTLSGFTIPDNFSISEAFDDLDISVSWDEFLSTDFYQNAKDFFSGLNYGEYQYNSNQLMT